MTVKIRKNFQVHETKGETFTKPSLTIPDQAYTVQEMQQRLSRGLPLNGQKVPMYDPETGPLPELHKLELTELMALQKATQGAIQKATEELEKQRMEEQRKRTEEFYRKKFEKENPLLITEVEEVK